MLFIFSLREEEILEHTVCKNGVLTHILKDRKNLYDITQEALSDPNFHSQKLDTLAQSLQLSSGIP